MVMIRYVFGVKLFGMSVSFGLLLLFFVSHTASNRNIVAERTLSVKGCSANGISVTQGVFFGIVGVPKLNTT